MTECLSRFNKSKVLTRTRKSYDYLDEKYNHTADFSKIKKKPWTIEEDDLVVRLV